MSKSQGTIAEIAAGQGVEIFDEAPQAIRKPLCLVGGHAYAVSCVWVGNASSEYQTGMIIVRNDGRAFASTTIPNVERIADLGLSFELRDLPPNDRNWSGAGVKRYLAGERPNPALVFERIVQVVDHFIDFTRSLEDQRTMCDVTACYVLATYLLDAFNVIGYLWPNGERGSGKTHFLSVVTEMAYLGHLILAGGRKPTFP